MTAAWTAVFLVFFASRLWRLGVWPPFVDESIHVSWAHGAFRDGIPAALTDGKFLQILLCAGPVHVGPPLLAARLVSVAVGGIGLWALGRVARRLVGERAALAAAVLYVSCPFVLVYDRMALADVFCSTFALLALLLALRASESGALRDGIALGLAVAATILSKLTGLFVVVVPAWVLMVSRRGPRAMRAFVAAALVTIALCAGPVFYFFSESGQLTAKVQAKGGARHRIELVAHNLATASRWLWAYWTPPVVVLGALALPLGFRRRWRETAILAGASLAPILFVTLVARDWFPRYVLPATGPFLILAASALDAMAGWIAGRWPGFRVNVVALVLAAVAVLPSLRFDTLLLTNPLAAPLPGIEKFQYVTHWPAGYGYPEAVAYLAERRSASPLGITIAVDELGQPAPLYQMRAGFVADAAVDVRSLDLDAPGARDTLATWASARPTFLLVSERRLRESKDAPLPGWPVTDGPTFFRPNGVAVTRIYGIATAAAESSPAK